MKSNKLSDTDKENEKVNRYDIMKVNNACTPECAESGPKNDQSGLNLPNM